LRKSLSQEEKEVINEIASTHTQPDIEKTKCQSSAQKPNCNLTKEAVSYKTSILSWLQW